MFGLTPLDLNGPEILDIGGWLGEGDDVSGL